MSAANVRPIKSARGAAAGSLPAKVIERIDEARVMIFQAHSIAAVAAAAAVSEMPADEHCTETTLRLLSRMLDKVAALIEPGDLARAATDLEVSNGK